MRVSSARLWIAVASVALLGLGACVRTNLPEDEDERRRVRSAERFAERLSFDGATTRAELPASDPEGPRLVSVVCPLEIVQDEVFGIEVRAHEGPAATHLLFEIERSGVVFEVPLIDGRARGTLGAGPPLDDDDEELDLDRPSRQSIRIALAADGVVGPPVALPLSSVLALSGASPPQVLVHAPVPIEAIAFAGDRVVTGDALGRVWSWSRATGRVGWTELAHAARVHDLRLSGDQVFSVGADGDVRAADEATGAERWRVTAHDGVGRALDVHAATGQVVSGGWDGALSVRELATGAERARFELGERINDLAISDDGVEAVVALGRTTLPGALLRVDLASGEVLARADFEAEATAVARYADRVAVAVGRGEVRVYDPLLRDFEAREGAPRDTHEDLGTLGGALFGLTLGGRITGWGPDGTRVGQVAFDDASLAAAASGGTAALGSASGMVLLVDGVGP